MKKTFYFLLLLISIPAFAQNQEQSDEQSDEQIKELVKFGMFREIFWLRPIKHIGWVTDYEKLYSVSQKQQLNDLITQYEKETTIEFGIVTLDSMRTHSDRFEELSLRIANEWGIGKYEKDNGILVAISSDYRKIRIQNGNGIEKIISNEETKQIIDNVFIPEFKNNLYFEGTYRGIQELMQLLNRKLEE